MQPLLHNPLAVMMIIIMVILLLIIALLSHVLMGAAGYYADKTKEEEKKKDDDDSSGSAAAIMMLASLLLFFSMPAFAQDKAAAEKVVAAATIGGLAKPVFYIMTGVIFLEVIVVSVLLINLKILLAKERRKLSVAPAPLKKQFSWWNKINKFKPIHEEASVDLGHSYDGIRELDNRLPPWWLYGFYITIIFSGIYLWRYHVSHSAPSSEEEYQYAVTKAEEQKAEYLKKAAANVDENTVKQLTQEVDLQAGKTVFQANCAACHGNAGQGVVGPNLTDEYWLHGGSVKDIFKTIKYGIPEKGMKSWKDDFSPTQLSQLSSYILSLKGTNPPNPKEKQGDLYTEVATKDSSTAKVTLAP